MILIFLIKTRDILFLARLYSIVYCIVFIHFYSASRSMSLSEALPTTAVVGVYTFYMVVTR